jgi:hypothetical protein
VSEQQAEHPEGVLPGGDPDDVAEESTPGSDGDGPEAGYQESPEDEPTDGA